MDPIQEDELKLSIRMRHYQQYQEYLDEMDTSHKDTEQSGEMQGKKVTKIAADNSETGKVFNNFIKKLS